MNGIYCKLKSWFVLPLFYQAISLAIYPIKLLLIILFCCFLLDVFFDLPGYMIKQKVKYVLAWWQDSGQEQVLTNLRIQ